MRVECEELRERAILAGPSYPILAASGPHMPHDPAKPPLAASEMTATAPGMSDFGAELPAAGPTFWQTVSRLSCSERVRDLISFQVSLVFHCGLMICLALAMYQPDSAPVPQSLVMAPQATESESLDLLDTTFDTEQLMQDLADPGEDSLEPLELSQQLVTVDLESGGGVPLRSSEDIREIPVTDLLTISEAPVGGGFEGRTPQDRAELARRRGGTPESENAVERALAWLAEHQWQDGAWRLDHRRGPCNSRCRHPGETVETSIGATGLGLLPFLGAGYTHKQGPYAEVVRKGLDFLKANIKQTHGGGDLHWDTVVGMYAQGIATLALCEAYGMTGDPELAPYAQDAVGFICRAQHSRGGWRYKPQEPGDTTVTGWQLMALKSARLSQLSVPEPVFERTKRFLNTVQDGGGAFYGYISSTKDEGPTAVGLLLRMYLGWTRQDDRLIRGVRFLSREGPSHHDMYYNYYATQVLHHFGGPQWTEWNEEMRDFLVERQARQGHEAGSWFFPDEHGSKGGRHYTTAVCAMILEVYYRYMPLYGEPAVEW